MTDAEWKWIDQVPGWMGRVELDWLQALAGSVNSWTEVGAYCGRSMLAVGTCLPQGALLQVVDLLLAPSVDSAAFEELVGNWRDIDVALCRAELPANCAKLERWRPDLRLVFCSLPSVEAAKTLANTEVCFLDADHRYESVRDDILAWGDKCLVLCGHDYQPNWSGVVRAVDELCPGASNPVDSIWRRV